MKRAMAQAISVMGGLDCLICNGGVMAALYCSMYAKATCTCEFCSSHAMRDAAGKHAGDARPGRGRIPVGHEAPCHRHAHGPPCLVAGPAMMKQTLHHACMRGAGNLTLIRAAEEELIKNKAWHGAKAWRRRVACLGPCHHAARPLIACCSTCAGRHRARLVRRVQGPHARRPRQLRRGQSGAGRADAQPRVRAGSQGRARQQRAAGCAQAACMPGVCGACTGNALAGCHSAWLAVPLQQMLTLNSG